VKLFPPDFAVLVMLAACPSAAQVGPTSLERPPCPIGYWDGGEAEVAAQLRLLPDGRFAYAMSYGALDEVAEGRWEEKPGGVALTSDPFNPPRFVKLAEEPAEAPALQIELALPDGISRQFFEVIVTFSDGSSRIRQFTEDGLEIPLDGPAKPVAMAVLLPVLGIQSERFALAGSGARLTVRFEPNELGKVAFNATPMTGAGGELLLERHGRELHFRRSGGGCAGKYP